MWLDMTVKWASCPMYRRVGNIDTNAKDLVADSESDTGYYIKRLDETGFDLQTPKNFVV